MSDFEKLLTQEEIGILAHEIKGEYNSNSNQVMVVTIPTNYLGNLQIEEYAQQLFEKWQPGQKSLDNGVLMIIVGSKLDSVGRKLRIHTGYGIEGALPDLLCSRIEKEMIVPELKKGNYFKAIKNGCASILNFISKENIGKIPQYKIDVSLKGNFVYDYARIFTDEQQKNLEKELAGFLGAGKRYIITETSDKYENDHVYIRQKYSYDSCLFSVSFNPGYYTDPNDSILKFSETKKGYYLSMSTISDKLGLDDYNILYKIQDEQAVKIKTAGIYATCMGLLAQEKLAYAERFQHFILLLIFLFSVTVIVFGIHLFTKKYQYSNKKRKPAVIKIVLGIFLTLVNTYSFLSIVSLEIIYYLVFSDYTVMSSWMLIALLIVLAASQVVNIVFVARIDANYFNSKLFSWLGKGGGGSGGSNYNSSSNSSSSNTSSYNSSSSNSNSSSNGGYYGGGGRSGGGGASSDW